MTSRESSINYAAYSTAARRFGGLSSTVRLARKGSVLPFGFTPLEAVLARAGSVSAGAEGGLQGFRSAGARNSGECARGSIGEFTGNTRGYSTLIGAICRKIGIIVGKRLQFSGGWGKWKQ